MATNMETRRPHEPRYRQGKLLPGFLKDYFNDRTGVLVVRARDVKREHFGLWLPFTEPNYFALRPDSRHSFHVHELPLDPDNGSQLERAARLLRAATRYALRRDFLIERVYTHAAEPAMAGVFTDVFGEDKVTVSHFRGPGSGISGIEAGILPDAVEQWEMPTETIEYREVVESMH